jgi:hypothetical protein
MSSGDANKRPGIAPPAAGAGKSDVLDAAGLAAPDVKRSGRVQFDDRGNAIWEWSVSTGAFGREVSTDRLKKLENSGLSLAEDAPTPFDGVKPNPLGAVKGYNPYDSGKLGKAQQARKKTDLRKLSEWVKLKKQAAENKDE